MGEYCDNVDPVVESDASQSDDRLMQTVEGWGHHPREFEDWNVYYRSV
jgi:hypothetical protein